MASTDSKKTEAKKTDTKAPPAETVKAEVVSPSAAPPASTAVVQVGKAPPKTEELIEKSAAMTLPDALAHARRNKLVLGRVLALRDPSELDVECAEKLDLLRALSNDASLPAAIQKQVGLIVDQAGQVKPGMEEVTTRWRIPRIQIAQATSTTAAKPENAKNGDLFTTAGKILEKPFGIIPFHFSYENILFPQGAKIPACQAPDAKHGQPFGLCINCPHLPFGMQNGGKGDQKKTDCNNQIVAMVIAANDISQVYMIQFAKTSRSAGSALSTLASNQPVPWQQAYLLETEKGNSELGNYFKYKVSPTGKNAEEPVMKVASVLCELYTAERHRFLAEWYRGAASAPAMAAAAEGEFQGSKLDAGLAGEVEPYGLGEETSTPATSVRSTKAPM